MGQTIGRAPLLPAPKHFTNLPKSNVYELWEAFNDIAEGFGLTVDEFLEIVRVCLKDYLEYSEKKMDQIARSVFSILDDDENDLVDALEALSALCLMSGMTVEEKVKYIFGIFDFDESGLLSVDEMILALRTAISGLCKLSAIDAPLETDIEHLAIQAFGDIKSVDGGMIAREKFVAFCASCPEIISWLEYYGDIDEYGVENHLSADKMGDAFVTFGSRVIHRSTTEQAAMDRDNACFLALDIEDRGLAKDLGVNPAWRSIVAFTEPSELPPNIPSSAPDAHLKLDWVYGFNSKVSRQTVQYTHQGDLLYSAGNLCIVYELASKTQRYLNAHSDIVTCVATAPKLDTGASPVSEEGFSHGNPRQTLCVSGEAGKTPKVLVWVTSGIEAGSGPEVLKCLQGFHRDGVSQVCFSPDAELVLTVGASGFHCVGIYKWRSAELLFSAHASENAVLDATWANQRQFVTCGVNHVHFWTKEGFAYRRQRGLFGKKVAKQPILCVRPFGKVVITGCSSGHLTVWEGRNCIRSIKAHSGSITSMQVVPPKEGQPADTTGGLISGSTDGKIQLWTNQLELSTAFDLSSMGGLSRSLQSVNWDITQKKILVGSWSSEIYEMHDQEGYDLHDGPITQGHYEHRLFGICPNPVEPNEFCTVGEDRTVRIWDATAKRVKLMATLDTMAHCVSWSPDGELIAVGLGYTPRGFGPNAKRQRKDGAYVILAARDLTIVHEVRDSKFLINTIRFSPNGGLLAVGSADKAIYLYNAGDWAAVAKCRGHKGKVTHLDFSVDSRFIQSCDDIGELIFWEAETGEQRTARTMRDIQWETQTCVYGYPLQGAWGKHDDGCRLTAAARTQQGTTLATTDTFGRLRLWRYPCVGMDAAAAEYRAHGGGVSNAIFLIDDQTLLTTGQLDCCVLQWKVTLAGPPLDENFTEDELAGHQLNDLLDGEAFARKEEVEAANADDRKKIFMMEERAADEDFTPIRPWQRTVVAPTRPPPERVDEPVDGLRLDWVHGFRAGDVRQAVKLTQTGEVVFFAGATNVVLNVREMRQSFHSVHTDEVMANALHPTRTLVASAQQGKVPTIHVWDYEGSPQGGGLPSVRTITGQHRLGISHLSFSSDGKFLASVGMDAHHSLVVYDWENQTIVGERQTTEARTLDLAFPPSGRSQVVQVGKEFIRFWNFEGRNMTWESGALGRHGVWQAFLSVGFIGNRTVVGCQDGQLYLFAGTMLDRTVPGHNGAVNVISSTNEGCATGGQDGIVKVWNTVLETIMAVDLSSLGSLCPVIRSVHWESEMNKVVVGTLGAEIFLLNAGDGSNCRVGGGALVQGHSHEGQELHGLSAHPSQSLYCTVGDDATLRIWDVESRTVQAMHALEMASRCVAYSPKGERIAVGYGAPVKKNAKQFDGKWAVLNAEDFTVLHEARDSQKYLTEVKWSPTGSLLAFGSLDCKIYVYSCEAGYQLSAVATQHNSHIRSIDFSVNDQYFMSNCGAYELCFFESDTCMFLPAATRLKDVRWATQTSTMTWASQGCWPPQNDRTDVLTCDANLANEHGNTVLATGDNFGRIRLLRYPCDSALAQGKLYRAHGGASPISKVRWVAGDQYLVSVSAKERIVMQWIHDADDLAATDGSSAEVLELPEDARQAALGEETAGLSLQAAAVDPLGADLNLATAQQEVSAKPWLSAIVEPSEPPQIDPSMPSTTLALDRVFGVQVGCARHAIGYNVLGELVWPSACLCVVYSKQTHEQKFYAGHRAEVTSISISPDGRLVASGERSARPLVRVWDAVTCQELAVLGPFHRQGISCIAWSADGKTLATVGKDIEHSVAVWSSPSGGWNDARKLAYSPGDPQAVYFAAFLDQHFWGPGQVQAQLLAENAPKHPGYMFATGGIDHVKFWSLEGRTLTAERGLWGGQGKVQPILCGAASGPRLITGGASGHIYVWRGRRCDRMVRAHEGAVASLWACSSAIVSASVDGFVKLFNEKLEHLRAYGIHEAAVPPIIPQIKSVSGGLDKSGKHVVKLLVTTASSECYELAKDSGSWTLLAEGHFSKEQDGASGEVWAMAPHPTKPDIFATAGDDCTVRVWSINQGRLLRKAKLDVPSRAIAWSPNGRRILVGFGGSCRGVRTKKDGAFVLLSAETLEVLYEGRDARHWLHDAKFAPDGSTFALASHDQKVYLYDSRQNIMRAKCDKHNAEVLSLDFSQDSAYLQSDSADYEHLYYSAADGSYFKLPSQLKNVAWNTWSCKMGWPVQGIWPTMTNRSEDDGPPPEPVSVGRSTATDIIAAGYQDGRIKVFRYPCVSKSAEGLTLRGHVSNVSKVSFTCDDQYMISLGQADRTIMVWKVRKNDKK